MVAADLNRPHWLWHDEVTLERMQSGAGCIVFDIDGVLSDGSHRQHLVRARKWDQFFDAAPKDSVLEANRHLVDAALIRGSVVLLTGRPMRIRDLTVKWLYDNGLPWDLLVMREDGNRQSSVQFKRREIETMQTIGMTIELVFDDDARTVRAFEEDGIPVQYVHSGYYD